MTDCYSDGFGTEFCNDNAWILWGRWVLLGGILLAALSIYLVAACLSARRRHRAGEKPIPGTQWTLAINPPAYESRETLPGYSAGEGKAERGGNRDVEAVQTPPSAHAHEDRDGEGRYGY